MKAYVLHGIGDLRYGEVPVPDCPRGWALVEVRAAGICSSDVPRVYERGTYRFPTIPGHEFAGVVARAGEGTDPSLSGRRVGVFPLIPCRTCPQCREGRYETCSHYDYLGSRRDGGFAQYVAVPSWNLLPLPDGIPFEWAAMLEPLCVALHAVRAAGDVRGRSVAVVGTGMIGLAAAQWAARSGASGVAVIGRSAAKRPLADALGISYLVPGADGGAGEYDAVIEAVGTPSSVATAVRAAGSGGCVVLAGNPSSDVALPRDVYWRVLRKQLVLRGTWNSSYGGSRASEWTEAAAALSSGEVRVEPLVTHRFGQEDLASGLELMRRHEVPYCKVMTLWNGWAGEAHT